jgi:hypothetical protein
MSERNSRLIIAILTLVTAAVHLVVLNLQEIHPEFALNGLGYLGLLGALWFRFPYGQQRLVHYAYMAFAMVTIIAYFVVNMANGFGFLGLGTKAVEVLLIVFLWMDLKKLPA